MAINGNCLVCGRGLETIVEQYAMLCSTHLREDSGGRVYRDSRPILIPQGKTVTRYLEIRTDGNPTVSEPEPEERTLSPDELPKLHPCSHEELRIEMNGEDELVQCGQCGFGVKVQLADVLGYVLRQPESAERSAFMQMFIGGLVAVGRERLAEHPL